MKIEQNIPMPRRTGGPSGVKYPFREMQIGDSFLVATTDERGRAKAAIYYYTHSPDGKGRRFSSRKVSGGYRIWRIE